MQRKVLAVVFVVMMVSLAGCATLGEVELTPKEKGIIMMASYQFEYEDYQRQVVRADLTEPEKVVLRAKKEIMVEAYPKIALYQKYVEEGMSSAVLNQLEFEISELMNRLGSVLIQKLM